MDLSVFQISTDYKDRRSPPGWGTRLFAEILFIDKTHPTASAQVYQLRDLYIPSKDSIDIAKFNLTPNSREAFLLLGEMAESDRKKKEIILKDQRVVSYNHLVVISGRKPLLTFEDEELASALQALNDALRVKPKIPSSFATPFNKGSAQDKPCPFTPAPSTEKLAASNCPSSKHFEHVAHSCISGALPQSMTFELDIINRRLYEVQL